MENEKAVAEELSERATPALTRRDIIMKTIASVDGDAFKEFVRECPDGSIAIAAVIYTTVSISAAKAVVAEHDAFTHNITTRPQ